MLKYTYLLFTIFAFSWHATVNAYELSPMSLVLEEAGRNSTGTFRIYNNNDGPLTIELSAVRRVLEEGYYNTTEPADEDFLLMPPQAYIEPGQFQVFRIRYMADQQLGQSIGYRIIFRQLPVDLSHIEGDRIQLLTNVHAPVYVSPIGAQPALDLSLDFEELTDVSNFVTSEIDPSNELGVLKIHNRGDGLQDLSTGIFRFHFDEGVSEEFRWADVSPAVKVRHILPGGESKIPLEYVEKVQGRRVISVEFIDQS